MILEQKKLKQAQDKIKQLYKCNNNGEGLRSIGKWEIKENIDDLSNFELNEHQIKHAENILKRQNMFILMKEAYSEKYRIHDIFSFTFFYLCNIAGHLILNDWLGYEELNDLCMSIIKIGGFDFNYNE